MYIGILTYHNTRNFGAALQTYALLQTCLDLGANAEIIDYRSKSMSEAKSSAARSRAMGLRGRIRRVLHAPLAQVKERAFDRFALEYLVLGSPTYTDDAALTNELPEYDLVLIGSDQVWNFELNGADPAFFGGFAPTTTRVASYASSFGITSVPDDLVEQYRVGLTRVSPLSVREKVGIQLVHRLTGRSDACVHPDPVFLRSPAQWRAFVEGRGSMAVSGALLTYFIGPEGGTRAETLIAASGLRGRPRTKLAGGLSLRDIFSPLVSVRLDRGPLDFIQSIDASSFVLTDSFHATAMSIVLDRPFGVLLRGNPGKDARILELLESFGLEDRVVVCPADLRWQRPSQDRDTCSILVQMRDKAHTYLEGMLTS